MNKKQLLYRVVQHLRRRRKSFSWSTTFDHCSKKVLSQIEWK